MVGRKWRYGLVYLLIVGGLAFLFVRLPTSFLPNEDQGIMFSMISLPDNASQERTVEVLEKVEKHFLEDEARNVDGLFTVAGFSFSGRGQNAGIAFINLKDWGERPDPVSTIVGPGLWRSIADPGSPDLRLHAAGHHRVGQRHRFRVPARRSRRCRA